MRRALLARTSAHRVPFSPVAVNSDPIYAARRRIIVWDRAPGTRKLFATLEKREELNPAGQSLILVLQLNNTFSSAESRKNPLGLLMSRAIMHAGFPCPDAAAILVARLKPEVDFRNW